MECQNGRAASARQQCISLGWPIRHGTVVTIERVSSAVADLVMQAPVQERCGIPHHLLDILDPQADFSAADFYRRARRAVSDILEVCCGGTLSGCLDGQCTPHCSLCVLFRATEMKVSAAAWSHAYCGWWHRLLPALVCTQPPADSSP